VEVMLLLLPLLGATVTGLGSRALGETTALWIATTLAGLAALLGWLLWARGADDGPVTLWTWLESGTLSADLALQAGGHAALPLSALVTLAFLAQLTLHDWKLPKAAWPKGRPYRAPLSAALCLFTSAGVVALMAPHLLQLAAGIALAAASGALLAGIAYRKQAAGRAAQRVLVVGLFGVFCVLLTAGYGYLAIDAVAFETLLEDIAEWRALELEVFGVSTSAGALAALFVALAALALGGQILFHAWVWEIGTAPGPAVPVLFLGLPLLALSMLSSLWPILEAVPSAAGLLVNFGALSAVIMAAFAVAQLDIRKVAACLAAAQAGIALTFYGLGAPSLGVVHLLYQGFSLTLLAWGASAVFQARDHDGIHDGELADMGGLKRGMPWAYGAMVLGALGLTGVGFPVGAGGIGIGGFATLSAAFATAGEGYVLMLILAGSALVSIAVWRVVILTFHGASRHPAHDQTGTPADAGLYTRAVYLVLGAGVLAVPLLGPSVTAGPAPLFMVLPGATALTGLLIAIWLYGLKPASAATMTKTPGPVKRFLAESGEIETIMGAVLFKPALWIGRTFGHGFDRSFPNAGFERLAQGLLPRLERSWARLGTGRASPYALSALVALVLVSTIVAMVGA